MGRCRRHPHHSVVGVCAHCLNDRLLALMEEEEDEELMLHELYDMSPHAYNTYIPPYSSMQAGSFSKPGAPAPVLARRSSTDYNRAHVKQMAASYLHKHHHSLSSSPQLHPPYPKPAQRPPPPLDAHPPFIAEEITRKKRPSLWSILLRHKGDASIASKRQSLNAYNGERVHSPRDDYSGIVRVRHVGARAELEVSGAMRQRLDNCWKVDGNISDGFAHAVRPSLSSRREGHESSSRNDAAASPLSSPHFMASPSSQAHHHFPSPISKYTPPSPLRNETTYGDSGRASPGRQLPVSYGLSGHVENYGVFGYVQDDDTSRSSWISSFFPRRRRRSKSISGSDALRFTQASQLHSVAASPESGPKGRRKSVSFIDEDMQESPSRYIAAKLSQSNGIGIGLKSPDMLRRLAYEHLLGTKTIGTEVKASKQLFKSPKGSFHAALGDHSDGQEHSVSRGRSVNELAVNLSSPKVDSTSSKSPRAKLVSFLNKRKNGTVSIDCGRDARVSPVPMLRVRRDYLNHHDLHDDQDHDHPGHGGPQGLDGLQRHIEHRDGGLHLRHTEHHGVASKFKEEFQKSSMATDKDTLKSPRLMSLHAMKQLLKSPTLAPVRTYKETEDDDVQPPSQYTRSWSKAFSKTLSPMLGRKHKKKQSSRKQNFVHDGYAHTQHRYNDCQQTYDLPVNQGRPNVKYSGYHHGNQVSAQKHRLQHQHVKESSRGDELLVREMRVLPAVDEKGPPQQYSFLSKDYSAFSFYFSPRRPGSIVSTTRTAKKSSVR